MEVVVANKLTKYYGGNVGLNGLSFTIERGKITGLLGPNGSGKTTLIKILANLLKSYSGEVYINGVKPSIQTKSMVAYLPDRNFIDKNWTIIDAVDAFANFFADFDTSHAYAMIQELKLDPGYRFKELSKGNKEKVQLVLTLARKAELYIFDEPIAGVDPATRELVFSLILNNFNPNGAVVICTHLVRDIEDILDNVIFLNNGRSFLQANVAEIRKERGCSLDQIFREDFRCY